MSQNTEDLSQALESRDRYRRRLAARETPEQRMQRFIEVQRRAFETLRSSPEGWLNFLRRNYRARRTEPNE